MDPTKLLQKQHRAVEKLFAQAEKSEDASERADLVRSIIMSLEQHTRLEEEMFYPAVRRLEQAKAEEMVLEAYEEHHVVKTMMSELGEVDPEDERFSAKLTVLKELIEHHVEEEESEMFKLAKRIEKEELADLGEQMAREAGETESDGDEQPRQKRKAPARGRSRSRRAA